MSPNVPQLLLHFGIPPGRLVQPGFEFVHRALQGGLGIASIRRDSGWLLTSASAAELYKARHAAECQMDWQRGKGDQSADQTRCDERAVPRRGERI